MQKRALGHTRPVLSSRMLYERLAARIANIGRLLTRITGLLCVGRLLRDALPIIVAAMLASGCVDVDELVDVNADGSGSTTFTLRYDPMYTAAADDLLTRIGPAWKVLQDKLLPTGGRIVVVRRNFRSLGELTTEEMGREYSLGIRSTGLLRQRFELKIRQHERYDWPILHTTRVRLPGRIQETNRLQEGAEVVWRAKPPSPGEELVAISSTWTFPTREGFDQWFNGWYLREKPIVVVDGRVMEVDPNGKKRELARIPSGWRPTDLNGTCLLLRRLETEELAYLDTAARWRLRHLPVLEGDSSPLAEVSPDGRFIALATGHADSAGRWRDTGIFIFDRLTETVERVDQGVSSSRLAKREATPLSSSSAVTQTHVSWPVGTAGVLLSRLSMGQVGSRWVSSWDAVLQEGDSWVPLRDHVPSLPDGAILGVSHDAMIVLDGSPARLLQINRSNGKQSEIIRAGEDEALSVAVARDMKRLGAITHLHRADSKEQQDSLLRVLDSGGTWQASVTQSFPKTQLSQWRWNEAGDALLVLASSYGPGGGVALEAPYLVDAATGTVSQLVDRAGTIGWLFVTRASLSLREARMGVLGLAGLVMLVFSVGCLLGARKFVRRTTARAGTRGAPSAALPICPTCSGPVTNDARFCASCGSMLRTG